MKVFESCIFANVYAVLLFGNSSCGCSSFATHYSLLAKVNPHANSRSAILRMSGTASFDSFVKFVDLQCFAPLADDALRPSYAPCVLVIDDVHVSVGTRAYEGRGLGNVHEVIRNMVQQQQFVLPVNSAEQSRSQKSNGKSFLQRNSNHIRIIATSNRSSLGAGAVTGLAAIPFAKLSWNDASGEIIQHIFKTTIAFQMLHIEPSVSKSLLDNMTSATLYAMSVLQRQAVMFEPSFAISNDDHARIAFVNFGEELTRDNKKGRVSGGRKWLKVEQRTVDGGSRSQLLLLVSAGAGFKGNEYVISSIHSGVPQGWDKEAAATNFYFVLDKADTFVCESERSSDWLLGVKYLLADLKGLRERVSEEWACDASEKLPIGVTFDLRSLGTVMTYLSAACVASSTVGPDEVWGWWREAMMQAFAPHESVSDRLCKAVDDAARAHLPNGIDELLASGPSSQRSSQVAKKRIAESVANPSNALSMQFPSLSMEHVKLLHACPGVAHFTEHLATLLHCQRLLVSCSYIDDTSSAVVAYACEKLGHAPIVFSSFASSRKHFALSDSSTSPKGSHTNSDQVVALQAFEACLQQCVRTVCKESQPAVLILTTMELSSLRSAWRALPQILDDGDCSELFSLGEISSLALDADEGTDNIKMLGFSNMLLQKLRGPKNARAVEELHEYDHVVPLFGLGREVLNSVSFFLGSTAARGRVMLGKNATGSSARLDSIMHARLSHDIKVLVLAESEHDLTDSAILQDFKGLMQGDMVATRLPSLSSASVFKDMLAHTLNRSNSTLLSVIRSDTLAETLHRLVGQNSKLVCQALQNSYEFVTSHIQKIDSCAAYQLLLQFRVLYAAKLHERQKIVDDKKVFADVEEEQVRIFALYRKLEEALLEQKRFAMSEMEEVLKEVVSFSVKISRQQQLLSQQAVSTQHLQLKIQDLSDSLETFSAYCNSAAIGLQKSDLSSLHDRDLDTHAKLVIDAAALLLNVPVNGCSMLVTPNGFLLHTPSHPASLNALITLQDEGLLERRIIHLGHGTLNEEMLELLLPILQLPRTTLRERKGSTIQLLFDLIERCAEEGNSMELVRQQQELQESVAADAKAARADADEIEQQIAVLKEQEQSACNVLDAKMTRLQTVKNELQAVQSSISRLSSVLKDLQSWRAASLIHGECMSETNHSSSTEAESNQAMPNLQVQETETDDTQNQHLLAQHCADLAAFIVFGGQIEGESRMKLLLGLKGIETFSCCGDKPDVNATDHRLDEFVNAVADDATQLLWQQCGMPAHPELFTSVSLMLASVQTPFVFDRTGVVLEFLQNLSSCNHSVSHDDDAPLPPPQIESSSDSSGLLVRSTRDFPIFVRSCLAATAWTDGGRTAGADCVVLTLPDSNDVIDVVTSSCNEGRLLVIRIPAQKSHASTALRSLNAFVPLLALSKVRRDGETVYFMGRVVTVHIRFACVIVNESNIEPFSELLPLLSVIRFTPGPDAMQQLLLRDFVFYNSMSLITSLCVMQQRLLCSIVENDSIKMRLIDELSSLSRFVSSSCGKDDQANPVPTSAEGMALLSSNLHNIEKCIDVVSRNKTSVSRVKALLLQLNASLAELMPYTTQYHPSLALAAASSANDLSASNMYHVFFSYFHSSFDENATGNSSPSKRNKTIKTSAGTGPAAAALVFRVLCALIPQKLRLPIAICALQDWMGGKDGLMLLVNAPLPPSSLARKIVKAAQPVHLSNVHATAGTISTGPVVKSSVTAPKKSSKGPSSVSGIIPGVSVPEVGVSGHIVHPGPSWMPIETYARLQQVIAA